MGSFCDATRPKLIPFISLQVGLHAPLRGSHHHAPSLWDSQREDARGQVRNDGGGNPSASVCRTGRGPPVSRSCSCCFKDCSKSGIALPCAAGLRNLLSSALKLSTVVLNSLFSCMRRALAFHSSRSLTTLAISSFILALSASSSFTFACKISMSCCWAITFKFHAWCWSAATLSSGLTAELRRSKRNRRCCSKYHHMSLSLAGSAGPGMASIVEPSSSEASRALERLRLRCRSKSSE
mmetsp:Transcript_29334/g.53977  ORF Transcript_29334/g.53977 Transcript_29334/m.53977 type:complete len:238 (-) Transcript_29334:373-1086(-)